MAGRLAGKVAIITGAGSQSEGIGNGRAISILFAREGARVLLVDRRAPAAGLTARMVSDEGGEAEPFEADVTSEEACRAMVDRAVERWGRLDILVNNVGIGIRRRIPDIELAEWELQMRVNVTSMVLASKYAIPAMKATAGGGAIVNISSIAALRGRGLAPYAASKGAVEALTRAMAADHGREGIRVNAIAPGPAYTPMVAGGMSEAAREARRKSTALGIEGTSWDIAWAAVYLCSDEARWVTGVVLPVDGGVLVN